MTTPQEIVGSGLSDFARQCPIFINVRDRVEDLARLVSWLEASGHERIILVDNDSSWPPLLEYLEQTPHEVMLLDGNYGSRSLWRAGKVPESEPFVFTDPDVMPLEECPRNAVDHLRLLLYAAPHQKVALGLYLEDLPPIPSLEWERTLRSPTRRRTVDRVIDGREVQLAYFDTLSDTSFALYRPHAPYSLRAIRTDFPLQVRHLPWYRLDDPTDEERYYLERAVKGPLGSSWAEDRARADG